MGQKPILMQGVNFGST